MTDHPKAPAYAERLLEHFTAEALRGEALDLRVAACAQLKLFGGPQPTVQLTLENWSSQHALADTRLLLEGAARANRPQAAAGVLQWLLEHRIADVRPPAFTSALEALRHASFSLWLGGFQRPPRHTGQATPA